MTSAHTTTTAPKGQKEATMAAHSSTITAASASEAGALDGFEIRCTCGLTFRTLFESSARREANAHEIWHDGAR